MVVIYIHHKTTKVERVAQERMRSIKHPVGTTDTDNTSMFKEVHVNTLKIWICMEILVGLIVA